MPRPMTATYSDQGIPVVVGEGSYMLTKPGELFDGTSPAVLAFHGASATDSGATWIDPLHGSASNHLYLQALARAGFIVISSAFGGDQWGAAAGTTKIEEAYDWTQANGCKSGPVGIYAGSAGAAMALNWWLSEPTHVGAFCLVVPALNLDNVYDDNASLQASMDAAWGGDYNTNGLAASPHRFVDDLPTVPGLLWGASDDAAIRWADCQSWAAAYGITPTDIGPGGHSALANFVPSVRDLFDTMAVLL